MAILIDKLKDKLGNFIYPITSTNAVYSTDGLTRLDNKLTSIDTSFTDETIPLKAFTKKNAVIYTGNLNDLTAGITWCESNAINLPTTCIGYCTTTMGVSGYASQIYTTATTNVSYSRTMVANVWGSWSKITPIVENDLFYKVGDTFITSSSAPYMGILVASRTAIIFLVDVPKSLSKVPTITMSSLSLTARTAAGGFLFQAQNTSTFLSSISVAREPENSNLRVTLNKTEGFGGTNDSAVVINGTMTFTFS